MKTILEKLTEYPSGALRSDDTGKGRYDLISPFGLKRLAVRYEEGIEHKGARNWENGFPVSRCCSSAIRHIFQYLEGCRAEDHLAAAAWQLFCVMHFEGKVEKGLLPKDLLDTPESGMAYPSFCSRCNHPWIGKTKKENCPICDKSDMVFTCDRPEAE